MEQENTSWTICEECYGQGRKKRRSRKKEKLHHLLKRNAMLTSEVEPIPSSVPSVHMYICMHCSGSGLVSAVTPPIPDTENYPHVAIVGVGIGGVALAVACLHRGIPFTLYERDTSFNERSQGYGLTLQQASKAIAGLGLFSLKDGVVSTRHLAHTPDGKVIGEWGMRKWNKPNPEASNKRTNVHIARQSLRMELLKQLGGEHMVKWGHLLTDVQESKGKGLELRFLVNGEVNKAKADLLVGADGIRSSVRKFIFKKEEQPLRYLGCMVILGICPLRDIKGEDSELLDAATVFQTANGKDRMYMMPYNKETIMWQFSFLISEHQAKELSEKGPNALKEEALKRANWHHPIPAILQATKETRISGYPVYDRALLEPKHLQNSESVTLLGDAAHPMSPFKGQGANQALLDALVLARGIYKGCRPLSEWKKIGIREAVLKDFEEEMLERSASKVKDSAAAAKFLHSDVVLQEADEPRGRSILREKLVDKGKK